MGKDKEYDILFNKYNRALAKAQDLQEQLTTKQEQWDKRNEDFDTVEKNVRELCEAILAKDNSEMKLGTDYSWSSIPVNELILKARKVFREYNAQRTDLMRKIMDTAEDRRAQIESLKEQIIMIKTQGNLSHSVSEEELKAQIEKDLTDKSDRENQIKNSKSMSVATQKAVEAGRVNIQVVKDSLANGDAEIIEEDDDFLDDEETQAGVVIHSKEKKVRMDATKDNHNAKITKKSIPVSPAKKAVKDRKELKQKLDKEYTMSILSELEEKISDAGWIIMDVIGKYGLSVASEIIDKGMEEGDIQKVTVSKAKLRSNLVDLSNIGVVKREQAKTPFGMFFVYTLTVDGARIYKSKHGKEPVLSEMDKIIAEHDNITHGYSIKQISEKIAQTGCYDKVEIWNRKTNAITVQGNVVYIPDLACVGKNGEHTFIEYELNHYTQRTFNIKCNKMLSCTTGINYIVPGREEAEKMLEKLVEWTKTKGTGGNMRHVIVRVTTAGSLSKMDLTKNENWMYTFRPTKDKSPVNHF